MIWTLQFLHLLAAALFLGNILATLVWKVRAERDGNPQLVAFVLKIALWADKLITAPGAGIITLSGMMLLLFGDTAAIRYLWLQLSIALWFASAAIAILYLVPSLKKLLELAETQQHEHKLSPAYYAAASRWNKWSAALILSPVIIFLLAIVKPSL